MLRVKADIFDKPKFIDSVYGHLGNYQTMIFVNTKKDAEMLENNLRAQGINANRLTSDI